MPVERKGRSMTAGPEDLKQWLGREVGAKSPVHIARSSDEDLLVNLRRGLEAVRTSKKEMASTLVTFLLCGTFTHFFFAAFTFAHLFR
jgi:hypothetical protein